MKSLFLFLMLMILAVPVLPQACGYTFLRLYLQTPQEKSVSAAEIKTYDKNFKNELNLYPEKDDSVDPFEKRLQWNEESQSYNGSEGMCGGHRDVGFRISAPGFENFDFVTDLPLGWTAYLVTLRPVGATDPPKATKLVRITGDIIDSRKQGIASVQVGTTEPQPAFFETFSRASGFYEIYLPPGKYDLKFVHQGFKTSIFKAYDISDGRHRRLDLALEASDVTTLPNIKNQ